MDTITCADLAQRLDRLATAVGYYRRGGAGSLETMTDAISDFDELAWRWAPALASVDMPQQLQDLLAAYRVDFVKLAYGYVAQLVDAWDRLPFTQDGSVDGFTKLGLSSHPQRRHK